MAMYTTLQERVPPFILLLNSCLGMVLAKTASPLPLSLQNPNYSVMKNTPPFSGALTSGKHGKSFTAFNKNGGNNL
jgi:hypothetical protein